MTSQRATFFILIILILCSAVGAVQMPRKPSTAKTEQLTRTKVPKDLVEQLIHDVPQIKSSYEGYVNELYDSLPMAHQIDLDEDGLQEFIVYGGAALSGNRSGPVWVYSQTKSGYKQLFGGSIAHDQGFAPLKTKTNGYRDFEFRSDSSVVVFKFNGKRYSPFR